MSICPQTVNANRFFLTDPRIVACPRHLESTFFSNERNFSSPSKQAPPLASRSTPLASKLPLKVPESEVLIMPWTLPLSFLASNERPSVACSARLSPYLYSAEPEPHSAPISSSLP